MEATPPPSPNFSSSSLLPSLPAPPSFSEKKNPFSVSNAWPYSKTFKLATKHPNAAALLCLRNPAACTGCSSPALGTFPKMPSHQDGDSLPEMVSWAFHTFLTRWPHAPWFGGWDAGLLSWALLVVLFPQHPMAGLAAEIPTLWELGAVRHLWDLTPKMCQDGLFSRARGHSGLHPDP